MVATCSAAKRSRRADGMHTGTGKLNAAVGVCPGRRSRLPSGDRRPCVSQLPPAMHAMRDACRPGDGGRHRASTGLQRPFDSSAIDCTARRVPPNRARRSSPAGAAPIRSRRPLLRPCAPSAPQIVMPPPQPPRFPDHATFSQAPTHRPAPRTTQTRVPESDIIQEDSSHPLQRRRRYSKRAL